MTPEPKGKLDAMTGYSFSTPVWDGGTWVTPVVTEVKVVAPKANGPEGDLDDWDRVDWGQAEENVRRLRQRIFAASQAGDLKKVRNLQKLTAPRGALSYPRFSREEFEGRFLGLMPYLEPKGEGDRSMAEN